MTKHVLLIILQLAAAGNDAYWTHRNTQSQWGYRENNPIARPFVKSTSGTVLYFSITTGLQLTTPEILRKRGHNKLADVTALAGIADNASGAVYSAIHWESR